MKPSPIISWAILGLIVVMLGGAAISALQTYISRAGDIAQMRALTESLEAQAARHDASMAELQALQATRPDVPYWEGADAELASLAFQEQVRGIFEAAGVLVNRTALEPNPVDRFTLDITASGVIEDLQVSIFALEQHTPLIQIDVMTLRISRDDQIAAQFRLNSPYVSP